LDEDFLKRFLKAMVLSRVSKIERELGTGTDGDLSGEGRLEMRRRRKRLRVVGVG
jgi:hypothetical protein